MSVRVLLKDETVYREQCQLNSFPILILFPLTLQNNSLEVTMELKQTRTQMSVRVLLKDETVYREHFKLKKLLDTNSFCTNATK